MANIPCLCRQFLHNTIKKSGFVVPACGSQSALQLMPFFGRKMSHAGYTAYTYRTSTMYTMALSSLKRVRMMDSVNVAAYLRGHVRCLSNSVQRCFSSTSPLPQKETVTIHFVMSDGKKKTAKAKLGDNLLDVVLQNNLEIDGYGACEGTLACSTCHLIFKPKEFAKLESKPTDEELDMLDLAYGLCDTSRLGCQVIVTKEMEGWEVNVPAGVADAREPGT